MDALILTLFVSLVLLVGALVLLAKVINEGDLEHAERLSLLPLDDDVASPARPTTALADGKGK